jgi:hypothetical protein
MVFGPSTVAKWSSHMTVRDPNWAPLKLWTCSEYPKAPLQLLRKLGSIAMRCESLNRCDVSLFQLLCYGVTLQVNTTPAPRATSPARPCGRSCFSSESVSTMENTQPHFGPGFFTSQAWLQLRADSYSRGDIKGLRVKTNDDFP